MTANSERIAPAPTDGPDWIAEVDPPRSDFAAALGGDPAAEGLPFSTPTDAGRPPRPVLVGPAGTTLDRVAGWLSDGEHAGMVSPFESVRASVRADLADRPGVVVASVPAGADPTPRGIYERVLRAGYDAGYDVDTGDYWQVDNGVPWATDETVDAVGRMARRAEADAATPVLAVDGIQPDLLDPLGTVADAGVRILATVPPDHRERLADLRAALGSDLRYAEGADTFSRADVETYVARSLRACRIDSGRDDGGSLFTGAAIRDVHERTGGDPRAVRRACRDLFARAALVWDRSTADADRIRVTPALRDRGP